MQRNLLWLVFTLFYAVEEESVPWRRKAMALDHCLCTAFSQLGVVLSRPISCRRIDSMLLLLSSSVLTTTANPLAVRQRAMT